MSEWKGKGSNPRPTVICREEKDLRWELAFGKDEAKKEIAKEKLSIILSNKEKIENQIMDKANDLDKYPHK